MTLGVGPFNLQKILTDCSGALDKISPPAITPFDSATLLPSFT